MNRRLGALIAAVVLLAGGAVVAVWLVRRRPVPPVLPPIPVARAPQATPPARASTIIDLPGDPALVRRAAANLPRPIALAVPLTLGAGQSPEFEALYASEPLTPAAGGYLGKFTDNGQQADALNAELAMNAAQASGAASDAGDDDDGGDATPQKSPAAAGDRRQHATARRHRGRRKRPAAAQGGRPAPDGRAENFGAAD